MISEAEMNVANADATAIPSLLSSRQRVAGIRLDPMTIILNVPLA
jgi:hypothetical protein